MASSGKPLTDLYDEIALSCLAGRKIPQQLTFASGNLAFFLYLPPWTVGTPESAADDIPMVKLSALLRSLPVPDDEDL